MSVGASDSEIYRKNAEALNRFAAGLVGPDDAADVVSEAILDCLRSKQWPLIENKRACLYRSVYNGAAEFHRSAARRRAREQRSAPTEGVESPNCDPRSWRPYSG